MDNTARKLEAENLINEVKSTHGSLDLLKVFLITGATDISKSYELINGWYKHAKNEADKANFENALKTLQEIELKRIELTSLIYNVSSTLNVNAEIIKEETESDNVILMLPTLDEVLDRVRNILKNGKDDIGKASIDAYSELKKTVGAGKAMTAERKSITWEDKAIHAFIDSYIDNNGLNKPEPIIEETKTTSTFGFQTIYEHFTELIKANKSEEEIKNSLRTLLIGQTITENGGSTYLIKDEAVFEDYYSRILANLIKVGIESYAKSIITPKGKIENADMIVEEEIKPFLENLDKDETVSSFVSVAKKLKESYTNLGIKNDLRDLLFKAKELGKKYAPNLFKRNQKENKSTIPTKTVELAPIQTVAETQSEVQIYDETHNIIESNKSLWEEVKDYQYLEQIFKKAEELEKNGNWRDALSMATILISSGKIKETEKSEEPLKWNNEQIREWYESLFYPFAKNDESSTTVETSTSEVTEGVTPTAETTPVQQIAVVTGTLESGSAKEQVVHMLKQSTEYKDKYQFVVYEAPTDSHNKSSMSFQVIDDVEGNEKDLLITKTNMINFMTEMRDKLVKQRNLQPEIKKEVQEKLSLYYDITNSDAKRISGGLVNEADAIRRELKKAEREAKKTRENVTVENPQLESAELNVESKETNESTNQVNESPTENTAGGSSTNSSNEKDYTGFEDIIKAKDKYNAHIAIYNKVKEFATNEEGIKAVFEIINVARKNNNYKKSFIRNWKPTPAADLLGAIKRIVERGEKVSKTTVE